MTPEIFESRELPKDWNAFLVHIRNEWTLEDADLFLTRVGNALTGLHASLPSPTNQDARHQDEMATNAAYHFFDALEVARKYFPASQHFQLNRLLQMFLRLKIQARPVSLEPWESTTIDDGSGGPPRLGHMPIHDIVDPLHKAHDAVRQLLAKRKK